MRSGWKAGKAAQEAWRVERVRREIAAMREQARCANYQCDIPGVHSLQTAEDWVKVERFLLAIYGFMDEQTRRHRRLAEGAFHPIRQFFTKHFDIDPAYWLRLGPSSASRRLAAIRTASYRNQLSARGT